MNMTETQVSAHSIPRIHWFGDPEDDETLKEALLVSSYFHTANDIFALASAAKEAKLKRKARSAAAKRTLALVTDK